jgi:elongation factor Tu
MPVATILIFADLTFTNKVDENFLMTVEDVFSISGRGTVVTGKIERGKIKVGDSIELIGFSSETIKAKVSGIESSMKMLSEAKKDDNVGLLISGVDRKQINRGMVICKPGTIKPYTDFSASIYLNTKSEGGRNSPVFDKYRPQFHFRNVDVSGEVSLLKGKESMNPGDSAIVTIKLVSPMALEKNMNFFIREGGRIVGKGTITNFIR